MFGYYRFILACFVLLSHLDVSLGGFNIGVASVVSFYMLAGFVVCNLLLHVFEPGKTLFARFYLERILRIYPLFLFVALLTVLFSVTTGFADYDLTFDVLWKNLLIVPTNYHPMFIDSSFYNETNYTIVPLSWSLGLELQAYLILPLVVFFKRVRVATTLLSLCVFVAACFEIIHTDHYGYKLLPGVLFVFNVGVSLAILHKSGGKISAFDRYYPVVLYAGCVFLAVLLGIFGKIHRPHSIQVIVGILISVPVISYFAQRDKKVIWGRIAGDLSYGIFLSHFLAIWMVDYFFLINRMDNPWQYVASVFCISFLISFMGIFSVEKMCKLRRYSLAKEKLI